METLTYRPVDDDILGLKTLNIVQHIFNARGAITIALISTALITVALAKFSAPTFDKREPPLAKPTIPFVGHIIGIIQHQNNYHQLLRSVYQPLQINLLQSDD
jgi:hypothetical protein